MKYLGGTFTSVCSLLSILFYFSHIFATSFSVKYIYYRLSIPYPKCLGPEVFRFFRILEYLHIEELFGDGTQPKYEIVFVSRTPYTYTLKVILYNICVLQHFFSRMHSPKQRESEKHSLGSTATLQSPLLSLLSSSLDFGHIHTVYFFKPTGLVLKLYIQSSEIQPP